MFSRSNLLIVLVAVAGALLGLILSSFPGDRGTFSSLHAVHALQPGDRRPNLNLPGTDGAEHRLSDWNGKWVLLNFWATWCGPCREEMPLLDKARTHLAADGLEVIGVAIDREAAVRNYLQIHPVGYPILLGGATAMDPSLQFGDTSSVLPYSVLIGRDGTVLAQRAGSFTATTLQQWLQAHLPGSPTG